MTQPLNVMQLKMLEIYSQGDFAWLSAYDSDKAIEMAKTTQVGDLMVAYLLAELSDAESAEDAADRMENKATEMTELAVALDSLR